MSGNETVALEAQPSQEGRKQGFIAAGGVFGAIAASSCCMVPLALFSLGVTGSWIGALTALMPYQPIFAAITFGFLGYGYYLVYWKPKKVYAADAACAQPLPKRVVKFSLWAATVLVLAALVFPYVAPLLLDA